jgi:hypothetical protein
VLELVEQPSRDLQPGDGAPQQPDRRRAVAVTQARGRALDLEARELEPELRGLMHRLEQELVAVNLFLRRLLQREQLVGAEVPLVVTPALPGQDGLRVILDLGRHQRAGWNSSSS